MENISYADSIIRTTSKLIVTYDNQGRHILRIVNIDPLLKTVAIRVATELFELSVAELDQDILIKDFGDWKFNRYLSFVRSSILELKSNKELSLNKIEIIQRVIV